MSFDFGVRLLVIFALFNVLGGYTILMPVAIIASRYFLRDICLRRYLLRDICFAIAALCLCVFVFKKNADAICDGFQFSIFNFASCVYVVWYFIQSICRKANYVSLLFKD